MNEERSEVLSHLNLVSRELRRMAKLLRLAGAFDKKQRLQMYRCAGSCETLAADLLKLREPAPSHL